MHYGDFIRRRAQRELRQRKIGHLFPPTELLDSVVFSIADERYAECWGRLTDEELIRRLTVLRVNRESANWEKEQWKLINIALKHRADPSENPGDPARLYLVLDPKDRQLAVRVQRELPELRVLVLGAKNEDLSEEQSILNLLVNLLKRELGQDRN